MKEDPSESMSKQSVEGMTTLQAPADEKGYSGTFGMLDNFLLHHSDTLTSCFRIDQPPKKQKLEGSSKDVKESE